MTDPLATDETRIDRWLCAVRLVKTRPLATRLCEGGHVLVNGSPAKPSTKVRAGDRVEALIADRERIVEVIRPIESRVGAAVAATCYVDHSPPVVAEDWASDHARTGGGPAEQAPAARVRARAQGARTPEPALVDEVGSVGPTPLAPTTPSNRSVCQCGGSRGHGAKRAAVSCGDRSKPGIRTPAAAQPRAVPFTER